MSSNDDDGDNDDRLLMSMVGNEIASTIGNEIASSVLLLILHYIRGSARWPPPNSGVRLRWLAETLSQQRVCLCASAAYCPSAPTQFTERKRRRETLFEMYVHRTITGKHVYTRAVIPLVWPAKRLHSNRDIHKCTHSAKCKSYVRKHAHTLSLQSTRQLQRSTWLPTAPEAHVNSSHHPTLGLCILTKHLAVSAPVHHSRDPRAHSPLLLPVCLPLPRTWRKPSIGTVRLTVAQCLRGHRACIIIWI